MRDHDDAVGTTTAADRKIFSIVERVVDTSKPWVVVAPDAGLGDQAGFCTVFPAAQNPAMTAVMLIEGYHELGYCPGCWYCA